MSSFSAHFRWTRSRTVGGSSAAAARGEENQTAATRRAGAATVNFLMASFYGRLR